MEQRIENIVFDMGNVLVRFDPAYFIALQTTGPAKQKILLEEVFKSVEWVMLDRGTIGIEEAIQSVCARIPEDLHSTVKKMVGEWHYNLLPVEGMEQLAAELKRQGYGIYLLSNAGLQYHEFRKRIPALRYFDGEFISADHQLLKPSKQIYQTFCETFQLDPVSCFFIDDFPLNVEAAIRFGMKGHIFHGDSTKCKAALEAAGVVLSGIQRKKSLSAI